MKYVFKESAVIFLMIVALVVFAMGLGHNAVLTRSNSLAAIYAESLVDLTNKDREKNNVNVLAVNSLLQEAARLKAEDMVSKGYFSHYGPDGSAPWDWIKKAGYDYIYAGENLAINFTDSKDVEKAWMDSPAHRANILSTDFTEIGIATAVGEYKGRKAIFVVQMFGTPKIKTFSQQGAHIVGNDLGHHIVSNPTAFVMYFYFAMFLVIAIGILKTIVSKHKKHHVRYMVCGIALIVVISALAWIYMSELPSLEIL